ncbi:MAG: bifunctional phosphoglucose/phosphomannose isomerase [Actinomycetota bacterium]
MNLDDAASLREGDPSGMLGAIERLPGDCREGYELGRATKELPSGEGISSLTFCGMGSSAHSGDLVRALFRDRIRIPVDVVRSPELPEYCGPHTLVVASSYSGDTAETLACFDEAVARGCRVLSIASGGALRERSRERNLPIVEIPSGLLMPRVSLGYFALGVLGALEHVGILPPLHADVEETLEVLVEVVERIRAGTPSQDNPAKRLAASIGDRMPVMWGAEGLGSVAAARWRTQFNENAKVPSFSSALPELDHNEVVGWAPGSGAAFALVALRHDGEHPDVALRFAASIEIAESAGAHAEEVAAAGRSPLAQLMSLLAMGDFTSVYSGLLRGVDPTPIEAIVRLKAALDGG